jgi:hypothetical protein
MINLLKYQILFTCKEPSSKLKDFVNHARQIKMSSFLIRHTSSPQSYTCLDTTKHDLNHIFISNNLFSIIKIGKFLGINELVGVLQHVEIIAIGGFLRKDDYDISIVFYTADNDLTIMGNYKPYLSYILDKDQCSNNLYSENEIDLTEFSPTCPHAQGHWIFHNLPLEIQLLVFSNLVEEPVEIVRQKILAATPK